MGPYRIGLFRRDGRQPLRPLVPVDGSATQTFRGAGRQAICTNFEQARSASPERGRGTFSPEARGADRRSGDQRSARETSRHACGAGQDGRPVLCEVQRDEQGRPVRRGLPHGGAHRHHPQVARLPARATKPMQREPKPAPFSMAARPRPTSTGRPSSKYPDFKKIMFFSLPRREPRAAPDRQGIARRWRSATRRCAGRSSRERS